MRRLLAFVVPLLAIMALAACGLSIVGSMDPSLPAEGGPDSLTAVDGSAEIDASGDAEALPEPMADGSIEEPLGDAGVVMTDCGITTLADTFNSGIDSTWVRTGDATRVTSSGNGYVRMTQVGQGSRKAGLFFTPTVTATEFKVSFRYYAQRPSVGWWETPRYADGVTFTWFTSGDKDDLSSTNNGHTLAVPRKMGGAAFALDSFTNSSINDPSTPSFSLLRVDPARGDPGAYDWHVRNRGPYSNLYDTWRDVSVTYQGGLLSATVSTTNIFQNEAVTVPAGKIVAIGFTASTGGGHPVGYYIDTVRIELLNATCPE
ncbi:MAG: hypothetical protein KF819_01805 [Labilithrix sp.]|nr:hypothetical protein [Labilithrix sp.]